MSRERAIDRVGRPVQQSLSLHRADYSGLNLNRLVLGIVLDVYPSDNRANRSAQQRADFHGFMHMANVLVVLDGRDTFTILNNVVITPDVASGLDDYREKLPRPCSTQLSGEAYNSTLSRISFNNLDGDWCVVGFLGGSIDQPFVVRWWPHPANTMDPATSGQQQPTQPQQTTLVQNKRFFQRINGLEFVVTDIGHLYLSTYRANSALQFGRNLSPDEGRFPRTHNDDDGGSVRVTIKPSQILELDWNEPIDGIGIGDQADPNLPQTNPSSNQTSNGEKQNTYWKITKDRVTVSVPERLQATSNQDILLKSSQDTTLTVEQDLEFDVTGNTTISTQQDLNVNTTGTTSITSTLTKLNGETLGGVVGGEQFLTMLTTLATAVQTAAASATYDAAAWNAFSTAMNALVAAFPSTVSTTVKVGT